VSTAVHASLDKTSHYNIIPGDSKDFNQVLEWYRVCPVPGYDIKSVHIVHNSQLARMFEGRVDLLQRRATNSAFAPKWNHNCYGTQLKQRQRVMQLFQSITKPHSYARYPQVSFLPLWHGSNPLVLESIFTTGFVNLATTDNGFFGKGLYNTPEAEYAYRVYSKGALLVNWVAVFSAFPVVAQDEDNLLGTANFQNYDAHFVPVFSPNHPTTNYHACNEGEVHQYTELVVFDSSQVIPRYVVELQKKFNTQSPLGTSFNKQNK